MEINEEEPLLILSSRTLWRRVVRICTLEHLSLRPQHLGELQINPPCLQRCPTDLFTEWRISNRSEFYPTTTPSIWEKRHGCDGRAKIVGNLDYQIHPDYDAVKRCEKCSFGGCDTVFAKNEALPPPEYTNASRVLTIKAPVFCNEAEESHKAHSFDRYPYLFESK